MDYIYEFIKSYTTEIVLSAAVLSLVSFLLVLANYFRTGKILRKYKRLMRGSDNKNLEAFLGDQPDRISVPQWCFQLFGSLYLSSPAVMKMTDKITTWIISELFTIPI
jgi:hypothetical protein